MCMSSGFPGSISIVHSRCQYIAVAAKHYSPGGHGSDGKKRSHKEAKANRELLKCFGVSSIKDVFSCCSLSSWCCTLDVGLQA